MRTRSPHRPPSSLIARARAYLWLIVAAAPLESEPHLASYHRNTSSVVDCFRAHDALHPAGEASQQTSVPDRSALVFVALHSAAGLNHSQSNAHRMVRASHPSPPSSQAASGSAYPFGCVLVVHCTLVTHYPGGTLRLAGPCCMAHRLRGVWACMLYTAEQRPAPRASPRHSTCSGTLRSDARARCGR